MEAFTVVGLTSVGCVAFIGMIYAELLLLGRGKMQNYVYHYDDMDKDTRPPSCYLLKYRGVAYWSCYRIHLRDWLNIKYSITSI